jgi:hypothetical protein
MKMRLLVGVAFGVAAACLFAPSAANAQATRTWVSGVGDDANPCSRTAPCKTFAGAISKTAAAGEINCIDPGGFGALTITKSIAIKCDSDPEAGVLVSGTNGFVVSAASTDIVWISGIDFEGLGPTALSLNGIKVLSAAMVTVSNCTIRGFGSTNGTDGNGIFLNNTGTTKLDVYDSLIADNANVGIEIKPQAGASANVEISRTRAANGAVGIRANGSTSTAMNMDITDSVVTQNGGSGVAIATGSTNTNVMVTRTAVSYNAGFGLNAATGGVLRVGYSSITGNGTATNGGGVFSYGNNEINGNGTDTTPSPIPLH